MVVGFGLNSLVSSGVVEVIFHTMDVLERYPAKMDIWGPKRQADVLEGEPRRWSSLVPEERKD
jgi:hypothetical protein